MRKGERDGKKEMGVIETVMSNIFLHIFSFIYLHMSDSS